MKLVDIVGARPQFIKAAPISRAIEKHNQEYSNRPIREILVHTGQHYDYEMSKIFFEELELKEPDYNLGVGSGAHGYQTGEMLKRIEEVLLKEEPDTVIVYGDTNSTLAGALAAAKLQILVAHVEAGLRSFNKRMPEEINRVLTDHVSTILLCPTEAAVRNLKKEGFTNILNKGKLIEFVPDFPLLTLNSELLTLDSPLVLNVGDVMYDSVLYNAQLAEKRSHILEKLELKPNGYALATVHRAENTDDPKRLESIFCALEKIAQGGLPVIVPLHPRTRKQLRSLANPINSMNPKNSTNLIIIEPVSYLDMLLLEKNAEVILADSGGVQKEAYFFRVPCVTLREETEWVETVEAGWNVLVGCESERIIEAVRSAQAGSDRQDFYGDGRAAKRIFQLLYNYPRVRSGGNKDGKS